MIKGFVWPKTSMDTTICFWGFYMVINKRDGKISFWGINYSMHFVIPSCLRTISLMLTCIMSTNMMKEIVSEMF